MADFHYRGALPETGCSHPASPCPSLVLSDFLQTIQNTDKSIYVTLSSTKIPSGLLSTVNPVPLISVHIYIQ
jgi:hypothetical protein